MVIAYIMSSRKQNVVEQEMDSIFLQSRRYNFGLRVNRKFVKTNFDSWANLSVQGYCMVCYKNGCPIEWPDFVKQPLRKNRKQYFPLLQTYKLHLMWDDNRLVFFIKYAKLIPKGDRVDVQDFVNQEILQIMKKLAPQLQEMAKESNLAYYLNFVSTLFGIQKIHNILQFKGRNGAKRQIKANLQFSRGLKTILEKSSQISTQRQENGPLKMVKFDKTLPNQPQTASLAGNLNEQLLKMSRQLIKKEGVNGNLYQIVEVIEQGHNLVLIGGVSNVEKKSIASLSYIDKQNVKHVIKSSPFKKIYLAKKIVRQSDNLQNNEKRFERQLDIVRHIVQKSPNPKFYLLNYYYYISRKDVYYVEWHEHSLATYLEKYRRSLSIEELFFIAIQVVIIIIDLHACGVVHRDIKPSNFMVDTTRGTKYPLLKLIDFSDSMTMDAKSRDEVVRGDVKIYSTPTYCPLECATFSENHLKEGLINKEIDYWSVGIVLFQIMYGFLPISYSSCTSKDIHALWRHQFMNHTKARKQVNVASSACVFNLIAVEMIKIKQQDRLNLNKALAILLISRKYLEIFKGLSISPSLP